MSATHGWFTASEDEGEWDIESILSVAGATLPPAARLSRHEADAPSTSGAWTLRGFRSNQRYATRSEADELVIRQADLGRQSSRLAVLIPITKSPEWWALAQDERRAIFEESSRHIAIGLEYLPEIARRLYHSRDLGEPFDFLTWFEFTPASRPMFDDLLGRLRASEEWRYVIREVEVRVVRR